MVISLLALFVSLGGTSYAITTLDDDSVTTTKIKDGAVTGPKLALRSVDGTKIVAGSVDGSHLKSGAVKLANIFDGSVDSAKIKDGSVALGDLKANSFGDVTTRAETPGATANTIRVTLDSQSASSDRWTLVDTLKLAAGTHLVFVTANVLVGRETSGFSTVMCRMSKGVPGSSGARTYDLQNIDVSADDFVQQRLVMMAPVESTTTLQVGLYCALSYHDPDDFAALINQPRWNAIHVTGSHAPPS